MAVSREEALRELARRELARREQQQVSPVAAVLNTLTQGATFGFSDEAAAGLAAAVKAPFSERRFGDIYQEQLQTERANLSASKAQYPKTAIAGEIVGAIAPTARVVQGAQVAAKVPRAVRAAAVGASGAGAYAAGTAEDDRAGAALRAAPVGAIAGPVLSGAGNVAAKAVGRLASRPPTTAQLRQAADALYQSADNSGVVVSRAAMQRIGKQLQVRAAKEGIDQTLHPKALAALHRVTGTNEHVSLKGMEILRRVIGDAASSNDRAERRVARILIEEFDKAVNSLGSRDVLAGNPADTRMLGQARELWSKMRKAETIETLIDRAHNRAAQFSGSGYENALRTEFRQLANNERRMRQFTKAEQEAIRRVARGAPIENTLRWLGKFAPTSIVSAALSGGVGYAAGGPVGGVALPAAGLAARGAATALTSRNAKVAAEMMRRGGTAPLQQAPAHVEGAALAASAKLAEEYQRRRKPRTTQ